MFGTIRKHQTWLWAVIITLTIISFVIFFSPYSKLNDSRSSRANLGSIGGERITEEQFVQARREVALRYFFMSGGQFPDESARSSGFDIERETYQWLFLVQKQDQLGIHIDQTLAAQFARDMLAQFERQGLSSPQVFVKQVLEPRGLPVAAFEGFVRHYLGIQELIATIGVSGKLITPQEGRDLYVRENEQLAAEVVLFSATNYLASVAVTPEALNQYYTQASANYRLPERVVVNYVKFDQTNFLADAAQEMAKLTNINERLDFIYQQRGTNYYKDLKPADAKDKIREEMRKDYAMVTARKKANDFATVLLEMTNQVDNLALLAKSNNLPVLTTEPFDRQDGPKNLEVGADFATRAFSLNPTNDPYAGPIVGQDGVYVIGFKSKVASVVPPLDQIREKVTADYRQQQAASSARTAAASFYTTLTNGLAQGKAFDAVCAEAKQSPVTLPPFSMSSREVSPQIEEQIPLNQLKQLAFSTAPGKVSNLQFTANGGVVVFVKSKLPVDEAKLKTELPAFLTRARQMRQNEAFNDWFRKEAEKGLRDTPLAQPKPAPSMGKQGAKS